MKLTTWNARGLNAPSKKRLLKHNLNAFNSDIILIQETKLSKIEIDKFSKRLGIWRSIFQESRGASGGLGLIWDPRKVDVKNTHCTKNWISGKVHSLKSDLNFTIINVYGPISHTEKLSTWNEIGLILKDKENETCILGGDFNTILESNDKTGGIHALSQASRNFKDWCDSQNLANIPTNNGIYTWNNRRKDSAYIAEKLDRFLIRGELDSLNFNFLSSILPIAGSDHFPVKLEFFEPFKPMRNPFKCEKMWFLDPNFLNNIKTWWAQDSCDGSKMFIFIQKLKMLKDHILKWNRDQFSNIFKEKIEIEKQLEDLNSEVLSRGMDNKSYLLEKELLAKQEVILSKEEIFWRQKSRERWLAEGDRNTKYFHNSTLYNRAKNNITSIKDQQGINTEKSGEIAGIFVNYFKGILNNQQSSNLAAQSRLLKVIPKIVSQEDNIDLNKPITLEEVRKTVFEMNPDKSPGPDGFQAFFFQKCWDIIGMDLWRAIEASRKGGSILTEINHSFITLIPKKPDPEGPGDFRPIALCNTVYKIFSKILANRLKKILPKIISEEQTGFMPGRSILDGIITIQETIHSAGLNKEECMLLKLDIQKAYDMVDWRFLCKMLEAFGFARQWINLIFKFISTPKISVLVNGTPEGFFEVSRGIRQGDPLSPFLFIIMAEAFGRAISDAYNKKRLSGITVTKDVPNITHQQFADDTILPGKSEISEAHTLKKIINLYMEASGQKVNALKSEIFFINTSPNMEEQICKIMGYKKGAFPCKYLGIALEKGTKAGKVWDNTLEKLDNKLCSWKDRWLTKAGKCTKICAVLSAIPTYPLSCLPLSKQNLNKFNSKMRNFLWNDRDKDKLALIKWENICKPKDLGGLGVKNLQWQNEALGAKLIWRLFQESNRKWAKILYNKYLIAEDPLSIFRIHNPPKGSECWNFMIKCRPLISKFLTWDMGAGEEALFWDDSWEGKPPLNSFMTNSYLKSRLTELWGSNIKDYCLRSDSEDSPTWHWKSLRGLNFDESEVRQFEKLLEGRKPPQSDKSDTLIWAAANNGKYNVREGYKAILTAKKPKTVDIPLKLCWDPSCLPKAGFFLWLAIQNRIPSMDRLYKSGIQGPSRCILCLHNSENVDHLLYLCPYAQNCWDWLRRKLEWSSPFPRSFSDLIWSWPTNWGKSVYSKLWNISPSILIWELWKERNRRIFRNSELKAEHLVSKIEVSIVETINSYLTKVSLEEGSFSRWDGLMKKSWSNLINPPLYYAKANKEARKNCRWEPPPPGWVKLNFDGAARGNPGIAGIGCIIHDEKGSWIAKKATPINPTSNNLAELEALHQGIKLCLKFNLFKVCIEGDSQIIVNAIRKRSTPNWVLESQLGVVLSLIDKLEDYRISHIYREGNQLADQLANCGADGNSILSINVPPSS